MYTSVLYFSLSFLPSSHSISVASALPSSFLPRLALEDGLLLLVNHDELFSQVEPP